MARVLIAYFSRTGNIEKMAAAVKEFLDRSVKHHGMIIQGDPEKDHYGPIAVEAPDKRSAGECRKRGRSVAELTKRLFG